MLRGFCISTVAATWSTSITRAMVIPAMTLSAGGSGVAWAEDYTGIERWDALDNVGDQWRTLVGIRFRYVTWQVEDVGVIAWDEIDSTGWVTRHIEAKPPDGSYTTAASQAEVIAARDTGGIDAVRAYEMVYGVVPEAPLPDDQPALTPVSAYEFVQRWITARNELGAGPRSS